jgi:RNA polymerase sigma-B factor
VADVQIDVRRLGGADVVRVRGTLDVTTAARLREVLNGRLAEGRVHLVVDMAELKIFDDRAAAMLEAFAGRARRAGGSLSAVAPASGPASLASGDRGGHLRVYDDPAPVLAAFPPGDCPSSVDDPTWPGSRDITVHALLVAADRLPADSPDRVELRRQAIEGAMPLARRLARRFRDRGEPGDDLTQVAMVGLVNAVDGYDPARGCEFAGYATPTIVGELRRYFRDKGWRIRVPRRLQELRMRVNRASAELSQTRAAMPTLADIATHLSVSESDVAEAVEVGQLYQPMSLSAPGAADADLGLHDPPGSDDPAIDVVEQRESVRPLLATLPERQRAILRMRFFGEMTQSQIADQLGISQMHVSRLLSQTLDSLRAALVDAA